MRIAQVAPLYESVPPAMYGGTERVVHNLTEELVAMGHQVSLFASGDSRTSAELIPGCPKALRLSKNCRDPLAYHMVMLSQVMALHKRFDIVHFHVDYLHFPLSRAIGLRQVTTLHGRLDLPELRPVYERFNDMPVVSISDAQRKPIPNANWIGTVYHGLPPNELPFSNAPSEYFAFVGRISPEKRVDRAISIAKALGVPLKIAAKVDAADKEYYETRIAPLLDDPLVEFIGEINETTKAEFLGHARALLFPIDWPEPFGLVMIEAMSCGTPVVAFRHGSVPEVIEEGVSGYVVDDMASAIAAAAKASELDRAAVRKAFERRFAARIMAESYVRLYEDICHVRERAA